MLPDEGYIKFNLQWKQAPALSGNITKEIIRYRNVCFQKGYIGMAKGVGYGNISVRYKKTNQFIISGTQTGGLKKLSARHFTLVTNVDFEKNTVFCKGPVKASAESLTHAMFYRLDAAINCVIHIHHRAMWSKLMYKIPATDVNIPYGTMEMSKEVERLYRDSDLKAKRMLVMTGHQDGVIAIGKNAADALSVLDYFALNL